MYYSSKNVFFFERFNDMKARGDEYFIIVIISRVIADFL